jgi:alpha-methylacyl-CoA racemase
MLKKISRCQGLDISEDEDVTKERLEKEFKKKTLKEWTEIFDELDACVSPVLEMNEAPLYEHNKVRNSFLNIGAITTIFVGILTLKRILV